jgi:hypothetical protein
VGGIINIVVGLLMVAAGLSGKFVLIGTHSGLLLAVVGGIVFGLGCWRLIQGRSGSDG